MIKYMAYVCFAPHQLTMLDTSIACAIALLLAAVLSLQHYIIQSKMIASFDKGMLQGRQRLT